MAASSDFEELPFALFPEPPSELEEEEEEDEEEDEDSDVAVETSFEDPSLGLAPLAESPDLDELSDDDASALAAVSRWRLRVP